MTLTSIALPGAQNVDAALNLTRNRCAWHNPRPARRQFDPQRHPLDKLANMNDMLMLMLGGKLALQALGAGGE
jgi:hypothetical protein